MLPPLGIEDRGNLKTRRGKRMENWELVSMWGDQSAVTFWDWVWLYPDLLCTLMMLMTNWGRPHNLEARLASSLSSFRRLLTTKLFKWPFSP